MGGAELVLRYAREAATFRDRTSKHLGDAAEAWWVCVCGVVW